MVIQCQFIYNKYRKKKKLKKKNRKTFYLFVRYTNIHQHIQIYTYTYIYYIYFFLVVGIKQPLNLLSTLTIHSNIKSYLISYTSFKQHLHLIQTTIYIYSQQQQQQIISLSIYFNIIVIISSFLYPLPPLQTGDNFILKCQPPSL